MLFMILMKNLFFTPMMEVKKERANYIDNNKKLALTARDNAEQMLVDYEKKITQARIEANDTVAKATGIANKHKYTVLQDTANKINEHLNLAREGISRDKNEAIKSLKPQVLSLAQSISTKILGEEISISGVSPDMIDRIISR